MARIRTLKPGAWRQAKVRSLSRDGRLFWVVLITQADDEGRFQFLPHALIGDGYPNDDDVSPTLIRTWMDEVVAAGLAVVYQAKDDTFGELHDWLDHQRISKPTPSRLPGRPGIPGSPPVAGEEDPVRGWITQPTEGIPANSDTAPGNPGEAPVGSGSGSGSGSGEGGGSGSGAAGAAAAAAPSPFEVDVLTWLDATFDEGRRQRARWALSLETESEQRARTWALLRGTSEAIARGVIRDVTDAVAANTIQRGLADAVRAFIGHAERLTASTPEADANLARLADKFAGVSS